jgi:L-alanine-DL-glutamate epimerase-like enolase superfamily enzyme
VTIPLREPFATSRGAIDVLASVEFALITEGTAPVVGWATPATRITGETLDSLEAALSGPLADSVCGVPLDEPDVLLERLQSSAPLHGVARAALDIAVHRLLAACAGTTLTSLLGGAYPVRADTDVTVSADTPASMAAAAMARVGAGFRTLKLKVGGLPDPEAEVARVLAVRAAVTPDVVLRLDANQAWSPTFAVAFLDRLSAVGVDLEFIEQPVLAEDLAGLAWVRERSRYPVMADESIATAADVARVADLAAADLVNIKLAKAGGIRPALAAIETARAAGLPCMLGCLLEMPGNVAAAAALAAGTSWPGAHDLDAGWWVCRPDDPPDDTHLSYAPPFVHVDG